MKGHEGRERPVTARIEYRGERSAFGQPMLRLVVGDEWIGFTADAAVRFAQQLAEAAVALYREDPQPPDQGSDS